MKKDNNFNDRTIRLIFIPLFGLAVPNAAGLINNSSYSALDLIFCYIYFIFISYSIWQGNRFFLFRLRERFSWLNTPVKKVMLLVLSNIFYTIPVTVLLLLIWYNYSKETLSWNVIFNTSLLCVICVLFISHIYETVFLIKEWETDKLKSERLEKAKAQAELEALKNQIDPHFIFNSLNTLSYLIENSPEKAKKFNDYLADVFRYILFNKERVFVLLKEEIEFLNNYLQLLKIRFENSLKVEMNFNGSISNSYLIPPNSLQVLLENAVKHNEFSEKFPLNVNINFDNSAVTFSNEIRKKTLMKDTPKTGLKNLNERYKLLTDKEIKIINNNGKFIVELPLLKL